MSACEPKVTDARLLRDICRHFLRDVAEIVSSPLVGSTDFEQLLILSPEILDEMRAQNRLDNVLAFRVPWTEASLRAKVRKALARERNRQEDGDDIPDDGSTFGEEEVDAALDDAEFFASHRIKRSLTVLFVFVDGDEPADLNHKLFLHFGFFMTEEDAPALTHPIFVQADSEASHGLSRYKQESFDTDLSPSGDQGGKTLSFQSPAVWLAACRAEEWLAPREDGRGRVVGALLGAWMKSADRDHAERERRLLQAAASAPVSQRRRRLLELTVARKLAPSPAVDRELHRLLHEAPTMPALDPASFDALARAFLGDLITILGGFAVEELDFQRLRLRDELDLDGLLHDERDDTLPGAPHQLELAVEAGRRKEGGPALVYLYLAADRDEGTDERLSRRYLRLRLSFPDHLVIPLAVFEGRGTGDHVSVCQYGEKNGDDLLLRLRYYAFSIGGNDPQDFYDDPRPVAWALASVMPSWRVKPIRIKLDSLMKVLEAQVDLDTREALWQFVTANLNLEGDDKARVEKELLEHADVMRETAIEYLDKRLGPFFPADLRTSIQAATDPMEIHRLLEAVYEKSVEEGLIPKQAIPSEWPIN